MLLLVSHASATVGLAWERADERFGMLRVPFQGAASPDVQWRSAFRGAVLALRRTGPYRPFEDVTFYAEGIAVTGLREQSREAVRRMLDQAVVQANGH
jgi:hypothetical protein